MCSSRQPYLLLLAAFLVGLVAACSKAPSPPEATSLPADGARPVAERIPLEYLCDRQQGESTAAFYQEYGTTIAAWSPDAPVTHVMEKIVDRGGAARMIDGARRLRDARHKGPNLTAAYAKFGKRVEALAAKNWKTDKPSEAEMDALTKASDANVLDGIAAFQKAYQPAGADRFAEAYRSHEREVLAMLRKNWRSAELGSAEIGVVIQLQGAHSIDVANAAVRSDANSRSAAVAEAFRANETHLRTLAQKKPGAKLTSEEENAACLLIRSYQTR